MTDEHPRWWFWAASYWVPMSGEPRWEHLYGLDLEDAREKLGSPDCARAVFAARRFPTGPRGEGRYGFNAVLVEWVDPGQFLWRKASVRSATFRSSERLYVVVGGEVGCVAERTGRRLAVPAEEGFAQSFFEDVGSAHSWLVWSDRLREAGDEAGADAAADFGRALGKVA